MWDVSASDVSCLEAERKYNGILEYVTVRIKSNPFEKTFVTFSNDFYSDAMMNVKYFISFE